MNELGKFPYLLRLAQIFRVVSELFVQENIYFKRITERLWFVGGLQAIGELLQVDCEIYGLTSDHYSVTLRRYAGMALTNLTFGDVANKVRNSAQFQI